MKADALPGPVGASFSRRQLLERTCLGFGSMVLADLLAGSLRAAAEPAFAPPNDLRPRPPHFPAKAKAIIQLVQNGGPSQMDLFDPKPELTRRAGQTAAGRRRDPPAQQRQHPACLRRLSSASTANAAWTSRRCCRTPPASWTSLCFIRSMHTEHNNHLEGLNMLLTCKIFPGRPVMGSWISYALGTENQSLPAYVVLRDPTGYTIGGKQLWANGYLPALYPGRRVQHEGRARAPSESGASAAPRRAAEQPALPAGQAEREASARTIPANRSSKRASATTNWRRACNSRPAKCSTSRRNPPPRRSSTASTIPWPGRYGLRCLMARRLVEQGVRFVQVTTSPGQPWDHHSRIKQDMRKIATEVDQGSAALVQDLKSRGLLDSTIVMWAGEFGRLPTTQNGDGRDHNRNAFTLWFAGGGFKKGLIYGETDEFGYKSVVNRVPVPDMIATVLHQLGLDHRTREVSARRTHGDALGCDRDGREGGSGPALESGACEL